MHFANNLNHLLKKKRWSQSSLAKELKISQPQVGRYINGSNEPKMEMLVTLGKLFNVTVDDLILLDLSKEDGRPFGGGVEAAATTDAQTELMVRLLTARVLELEEGIKNNDPGLAKDLGIE